MGTRFEAAGSILDALLPHPCLRMDDPTVTNTTTMSILKATASASGAACAGVGGAAADVRRGVWGLTSHLPPSPPAAAATTAPAAAAACVAACVTAPLRLSPSPPAAAMDVSIMDPVCDEVLDDDDDIMEGECVVEVGLCGGGGGGPHNTHAHKQVDTRAHTVDTLVCTEAEGSVRAGATSSSSNRADSSSSSRNGCTTTISAMPRLQEQPTHTTYNTPTHTAIPSYFVPIYMQPSSSSPTSELRLYRRAVLWKGSVCGKSVSDLAMLDFSTYGMDRMQAMESRQEHYVASPTYAENHPQLPPDFRTSTLAWMMEVCAQFRYRRRTYQLSVNLFERYLSTPKLVNFPAARLKLLAATSLFIAAKVEELAKQSATTFAAATEGACSATDIRSFETDMLVALKWVTNTPTLDEWVGCYILQLLATVSRSAAPPHIHNPPHTHAHTHTHDLSLPLGLLFDIVDLAMFDKFCLNFFPRQIAAAALYLVTPEHMHGALAACTGQRPEQRDMVCLIPYLAFIAGGMAEPYQAGVRYSAWDTGLQTDNRWLLAQLYRCQEAIQTLQYNPLSVYMAESITYAGELTEDDDDVSLFDDHDDDGSFTTTGGSDEDGFHHRRLQQRKQQQQQHAPSRSHHHHHHPHDREHHQQELHAPLSHSHNHHGHQQQQQPRRVVSGGGGGGGVACRLEFGRWKMLQRGVGTWEEEDRASLLLSGDGSVLSSDESLLSHDSLLSTTDTCEEGSWVGDDEDSDVDAEEHERDSIFDGNEEEVSLPGSWSEAEPDSEAEDGEESVCGGDARAVCGSAGGTGEGLECLEDTDSSTQDTIWSFDSVDTPRAADTHARTRTFVPEAVVACNLPRPHAYTQKQRDIQGNDSPCSVASDATCMSSSPFSGGGGGGGARVWGEFGAESAESGQLRDATTDTQSADGLLLSHAGDGGSSGGMSVDLPSSVYDPHQYTTTTTTEGPFTSTSLPASGSLMSPYGFLPSPSPPILLSSSSLSNRSIETIAPPSTAPGAAVPTHTHPATRAHRAAHNHTAAHTHSMSGGGDTHAFAHAHTRTSTHRDVAPSADAHTHAHIRMLKRSRPMSGSWSASPRTRARYMSSSQA